MSEIDLVFSAKKLMDEAPVPAGGSVTFCQDDTIYVIGEDTIEVYPPDLPDNHPFKRVNSPISEGERNEQEND